MADPMLNSWDAAAVAVVVSEAGADSLIGQEYVASTREMGSPQTGTFTTTC